MSDEKTSVDQKPKTAWFWLRNTDGKPSMSATFATVAFVAATGAYVAAIFEKFGSVTIRPFDSSACTAYLIPILGLYFGRRFTDAKLGSTAAASSTDSTKGS